MTREVERILPPHPAWLMEMRSSFSDRLLTVEERMTFVLRLAKRNIEERTGGPFGAAIFVRDTNQLVAVGVNSVVSLNCSLWHAEAVAIAYAQANFASYDLAAKGVPALELIVSAQPCVQCFGMIWWSGVKALVVGARARDVEELTAFNEGPIVADWDRQLESRERLGLPPVSVQHDVLREEARRVLQGYSSTGLPVYNPGSKLG